MAPSFAISTPTQLFEGLKWSTNFIAAVFTGGRLYLRWKYSKLQWDDLFSFLALLFLIVSSAMGTFQDTSPSDDLTSSFFQIGLACQMTMWTTFYMVKASFLALCWQIFRVSPAFQKIWYFTAVYTFLTFWPLFFLGLWSCGNPSEYDNPVACENFDASQLYLDGGSMATALHVSSDCLILILPLIFIRKLQMSKSQKLSAAAVFALIIIDIIMGFLRNVVAALSLTAEIPDTLLEIDVYLQIFEPAIAVIVCALPAYKVILPKARARRNQSNKNVPRAMAVRKLANKFKSLPSLGLEGYAIDAEGITNTERRADTLRQSPTKSPAYSEREVSSVETR